MSDLDSKTWLTYTEAAGRVNRSARSIRLWRREGMPMQWRNGPDGRERVVDEEVLLKWFRRKLQTNAVHQSKMRTYAREATLSVPEWPQALRHHPKPVHTPASPTQSDDPDPADVDLTARRDLLREVVADLQLKAGGPEYYALQEALKTEPSACDGITAFTDTISGDDEHAEMMEAICWRCPVLAQCRAFAEVAAPEGFWAGQRWASPQSRVSAA